MATEAVLATLRQLWSVLQASRVIDRSDAANLLRANATVINEHLLNSLVARLDLVRGLAEIRREAFG